MSQPRLLTFGYNLHIQKTSGMKAPMATKIGSIAVVSQDLPLTPFSDFFVTNHGFALRADQ